MTMKQYYLDSKKYSLTKFKKSLAARELIPSRRILKNDLDQNFDVLRSAGIRNLYELLAVLNSKSKTISFSEKTGLTTDFLTLLRREANSYFPTPVNLSKFASVESSLISKLMGYGIKTSKQLFEVMTSEQNLAPLIEDAGIQEHELSELISLSDLSRLYGVGPAFAAMLYEAGIDSVNTILRYSGEQIREMYETKTHRKADFTARDIDFTLEIAKELSS